MSETWVDAISTEDYEDIGEGVYDSEDIGEGTYDSDDAGEDLGEESRATRRRRERQRQIMLARQRQAQLRRQRQPSPGRRPAAGRQTITAIRSLDLETKVGQDSLRRALAESNRRASRATWAAVASAAVDQGLSTFDNDLQSHPYVAAGARFAPLLFLSPEKKRAGFEGIVTDPRVVGGAAILGIALIGSWRNRSAGVSKIMISHSTPLASGGSLSALAVDHSGAPLPSATFPVAWKSGPGDVTVDPVTGAVTGAAKAEGMVGAQVGGLTEWTHVKLS
jgi:hypothetical protein